MSRRLAKAIQLSGRTKKSVAADLSVSSGSVSNWIQNGVPPERVEQVASVLGVLPGFFDDDDDETAPIAPDECNFRSLRRTKASDRRRALGFCDLARDLARLIDSLEPDLLPECTVRIPDVQEGQLEEPIPSAEALGGRMRHVWGYRTGPAGNIVELLESMGVLVVTVPGFAASTIDAWSFWADGHPVVVLNQSKADPRRTRFDALHELGHFMLGHTPRPTEASGRVTRAPDKSQEKEADNFAGAVLIGAAWAREAPRTSNPLVFLRHRAHWGVSAAALIYAAGRMRALPDSLLKSAWVRYSHMGWRSGEPEEPDECYEQPTLLQGAVQTLMSRRGLRPEDLADMLGVGFESEDWDGVGAPKPGHIVRALLAGPPTEGQVVSLADRRAVRSALDLETDRLPEADIEVLFPS